MKKDWGSSMRTFAHVQEVAVVQGLQAEVVELQIALGFEAAPGAASQTAAAFRPAARPSRPF
jgi:hypothetical protein